jgi:hypothetical protein
MFEKVKVKHSFMLKFSPLDLDLTFLKWFYITKPELSQQIIHLIYEI